MISAVASPPRTSRSDLSNEINMNMTVEDKAEADELNRLTEELMEQAARIAGGDPAQTLVLLACCYTQAVRRIAEGMVNRAR
jgi:hypothetical protein